MSEKIDARVSPALHPATVRAVEGYNDRTAPFVSDVVSAFNDAYITIGKVWDATELGKKNEAWTEANRVLIVGKEAAKHQDRLLRRMDSVMTNLGNAITHVEGELSRPIKERASLGGLNAEVRTHCRGLDRSGRTKLLNEALAAGDDDTLCAILGCQAFLSGLAAEEHAHHLRKFHEKRNPDLVDRLGAMRAVMGKLERDATKVLVEMQKAVGATAQMVNVIGSAHDRALAALKIEPS